MVYSMSLLCIKNSLFPIELSREVKSEFFLHNRAQLTQQKSKHYLCSQHIKIMSPYVLFHILVAILEII